MKVVRHENGIDLVPESDFEREALKSIWHEKVKMDWEDSWNQKGNFQIRQDRIMYDD